MGQVLQVSPRAGWQAPLPQQEPQSAGQLWQLSPLSQMPLPQLGQTPQSCGQLEQVSPRLASHEPLPQLGQTPQSCGQVWHVSVASQTWLPQETPHEVPHSWHSDLQRSSHEFWQQYGSAAHTHASQAQPPQPGVGFTSQPVQWPQSAGQVEQSSSDAQTPLPQGQGPQSCGHVAQVSPSAGWQVPLPQQGPQSWGQVWQFSP